MDHTLETKRQEEDAVERIQQALGECTLRDSWNGTRRRLEGKLALSHAMLSRCERILPAGGEDAIEECHGPFERTYELELSDGSMQTVCERVCGARIDDHISGSRIDSRKLAE